ncbi:uncharacterized aarF domain-containing protein kinase 1 [Fopius arisanus]|nr:PREDICTED: uncharacterized aarF domain-containing protein kinase 1 [Fopius arisanus]
MWQARRFFKLTVLGAASLGTFASLRNNEYDISSIGIVRLSRAASSVFIIGSNYRKTLYSTSFPKDSPEYIQLTSSAHSFGAAQLLELCCANKGVYIKVGQHIGALEYLLPKEYVQAMKILHSKAPQSSFNDVLIVLREDLQKNPYEIFTTIDPEPIGAASLAQVHRAVLKDGAVVAVKVQHRSVKTNSYVDIKTMAALVKICSWIFPEFKFDWLVDETKKNIPRELDFYHEGQNAEKVQKMFNHYNWLKVPKIYWTLSTPRVLTMEFIEGGQVNDLNYIQQNNINPYEITSKLGKLYSHMIFVTGFVHSDPHPGNVLVQKNGKNETEIVLLDHGLYAELSDEFRWEYSKLWMSILNKDKEGMKRYCTDLGVDDLYGLLACMVSGRTWDTIMAGVERTKYTRGEKEMFQKEVPNLLPQISEVLERVNRQMLLILKTNDLIRSIEHTLGTSKRMSAFMEMSKCCVHAVYDEKMRNIERTRDRLAILLEKKWSLWKLFMYYTWLGVVNFDLKKSVESLLNKNIYLF